MAPDSLKSLLKRKGVLSVKELLTILGNRVSIKRQVEAGTLIPLGSGLYAHPGLDPLTASVLATSRFYKNTVISNFTALVIHGLSDEAIERVDVDIDKTKSIKNRLLRVHRVTGKKLVGIIKHNYKSHEIRVYDPERTLCEAYLIDPAGAVFFKALKRYLTRFKPDPQKINHYDTILKTEVLKHLRQEWADG
jgi:predicted transcriptional regulator of viral defense system